MIIQYNIMYAIDACTTEKQQFHQLTSLESNKDVETGCSQY